jgi:hypothetical protein
MRYRLELVHEAATEEGRSKVIDGRKEASLSLDLPHDVYGKADAEAQQYVKTMCAWMYTNVDDASQASIRWAMQPSDKSLRCGVQCPHHIWQQR